MENLLKDYIENLNRQYATGETTEHSFRGAFCTLCESILNASSNARSQKSSKEENYHIVNEPKRREYGAPDYVVLKGDTAIAFIEAKNVGDSDLRGENDKKHKEQFDRYKKAISTIAFTDYMNIILYENGEETISSSIAKFDNGHIVANEDPAQISNFEKILRQIAKANPQPIKSASDLADKMARKAKLIANILDNAMAKNETKEDQELQGKLSTFQKYLVHDMNTEQFVDFYAQTILYGLFIARINDKTPQTFSLLEASELIPEQNPFLKKIFKNLALADLHPFVKGIVEDLVLLFKVTDMKKVLRNYGKDPLVHFYEDFLEAYNPKIKQDFGVWYTPIQVVKFIVDSVDTILRSQLGIEDGLANNDIAEGSDYHKVQILDPATGTGTFLAETVEKIYQNYEGQEGIWDNDVVKHIIPRINGFEYLMAPYTMAHLKLSSALKLDEIHADIPERLNIFLTNSLEEEHPEENFDFAQYITDESNAASVIKRETPIMVVMGNPPYNEKSANKSKWIMDLMDDYKQEPGQKQIVKIVGRNKRIVKKNTLKEGNPKGINNDYCKFLRLGQNFVKKVNEGVLAYICGNTFLDTRLFRGMRYNLLQEFDDIYVINLHGSSKRSEGSDNIKDECVFDIMVGVSINIFVKRKDADHSQLATVHYKDVYGTRKEKLEFLVNNQIEDIDFKEIHPTSKFYVFRVRDEHKKEHYESGFHIKNLFLSGISQGIKTGLDPIVLRRNFEEIKSFCSDIRNMSEEQLMSKYEIETSESNLKKMRTFRPRFINSSFNPENSYTALQYRPFDIKWTVYNRLFMDRHRPDIGKNIVNKENWSLCVGQEGTSLGDSEWSLAYITNLPADTNMIPRGGIYVFPMYIYNDLGQKIINYSPNVLEKLETIINLHIQDSSDKEREEGGYLAIDLMDYIYAILHSSDYREMYHDFLQNDFPIIPYPKNADYFFTMAGFGKQLREAHLLIGIEKKDFITQYSVTEGDDIVTKKEFEETSDGLGRVWINKYRYFDNVPIAAWDLVISGYKPLEKWLKDRNGKKLSGEEIRHYQKTVVALCKTIDIQEKIDEIIQL